MLINTARLLTGSQVRDETENTVVEESYDYTYDDINDEVDDFDVEDDS